MSNISGFVIHEQIKLLFLSIFVIRNILKNCQEHIILESLDTILTAFTLLKGKIFLYA